MGSKRVKELEDRYSMGLCYNGVNMFSLCGWSRRLGKVPTRDWINKWLSTQDRILVLCGRGDEDLNHLILAVSSPKKFVLDVSLMGQLAVGFSWQCHSLLGVLIYSLRDWVIESLRLIFQRKYPFGEWWLHSLLLYMVICISRKRDMIGSVVKMRNECVVHLCLWWTQMGPFINVSDQE